MYIYYCSTLLLNFIFLYYMGGCLFVSFEVGDVVFCGSWVVLAYLLWLCNPWFACLPLFLFVYCVVGLYRG